MNYFKTFFIKLRNKIRKYIELIYRYIQKSRLLNCDFSIISNNCWGGGVYEDFNLPYLSPFVGLFIMAPDYLILLKDLKNYLELPIIFVSKSKYEQINSDRTEKHANYPIGKIGEVEIYFMHYQSEEEVLEKWERRKSRINWDNLYVKLCDCDLCNYELMSEFDKLPFRNKIMFSVKYFKDLKCLVWFKYHKDEENVGDLYSFKWRYRRYFDVVKWLNKR